MTAWLLSLALGLQAPSENAGRGGSYQVGTSKPGYAYWVYVPKAYADDRPAGLHLFFHGQNGQGGARNFNLWAKHFLDRHHLIGINMEFADGDNMRDTEGKVKAAQDAIARTMADYRIVAGRGVIASFSGGGLPHALFYDGEAKKGRGPAWPFCHASLYSSNYRSKPAHQRSTPQSWFVSVGQGEWTMAALGSDAVGRMTELFGDADRGGCPDLYLKVIKGKGHSIADEEVAASSELFRRSDLAFAPFLHAPSWPEKELKKAVEEAHALALGKAAASLDKIAADKSASDELKTKAARLRAAVAARAKAVVELCRELEKDPVLLAYYGPIFLRQLQGLPEAKEVKRRVADGTRSGGRALALVAPFRKSFRSFLGPDGLLAPAQAAFLEQVTSIAPESQIGRMAADFLLLR